MAELGIIAAVAQIADVGLRLSIKLYTFGEVVASADRSVLSISKDVSLTSGVLKELGQILEKDRKSQTFSENAVQTADGIVKECLEVFQEMENILVKKLPGLGATGKEGKSGQRVKRATLMLERLKWGYVQPKVQLLSGNLDRLKSTLLLMLNVITYAKQVSEKTESPSVIAEQRSLIEDLAHSNGEYIRKFESLKLGIEGHEDEDAEPTSKIGAVGTELGTKRKFMDFASAETPLQNKVKGLGFNKPTFATTLSPQPQSGMTRPLATPPNADINNVFINTSGQSHLALPSVQKRGIPTTEAPLGFDPEVLFKQVEQYSMLVKNLLKEVDEARYKITFQSRLRMKGGIAGLHEGERQELEKMWGCTALQKAELRHDSLEEGVKELPSINLHQNATALSDLCLPQHAMQLNMQQAQAQAHSQQNAMAPSNVCRPQYSMQPAQIIPQGGQPAANNPLYKAESSQNSSDFGTLSRPRHKFCKIRKSSLNIEGEKSHSNVVDAEVVDRLVSLWTTVKP